LTSGGDLEELLPGHLFFRRQGRGDHEPPLRFCGRTAEAHARLLGETVRFPRIAAHTGRHDILPVGLTADIARDDVIKVQFFLPENAATILTGMGVTEVDIAATKANLAAGHAIVGSEE
jgi:hypothetical protein